MPRQLFGELKVETLVHRGHHALHQQASDEVFSAYAQLFRQVFHAGAFTDGDGAGNGKRLVRQRQTRRRNKALHRAFFFPWDIWLAWTARWPARTCRSSCRWRRSAWTYTAHSRTRRIAAGTWRAGWVWAAALLPGPALIRRARARRASGAGWPRALKDWLSAHYALRTLSLTAFGLPATD